MYIEKIINDLSYRLCSLSTIVSIRVLNRPNSSNDSRRLLFVLSRVEHFAIVEDRLSFNTVWNGGTLGFVVVVTDVIILGFFVVSIGNEFDEHESVWSLQKKTISMKYSRLFIFWFTYFLLTESKVRVSS
jgi:hypothetical protein